MGIGGSLIGLLNVEAAAWARPHGSCLSRGQLVPGGGLGRLPPCAASACRLAGLPLVAGLPEAVSGPVRPGPANSAGAARLSLPAHFSAIIHAARPGSLRLPHPLLTAADVAAHTPPRALIVVAGVGDDTQCEVDIPYFAHRPVLSLHGMLAHARTFPAAQDALHTMLDKAFGASRNIYVRDEIWTNRRTVSALHRQCPEFSAASVESLFVDYRPIIAWHGPRGYVWKLSAG